ncbi:MAG: hypothetical protein ACLFUS_10245 [Candidatus Sumerlaeia bacterium]
MITIAGQGVGFEQLLAVLRAYGESLSGVRVEIFLRNIFFFQTGHTVMKN